MTGVKTLPLLLTLLSFSLLSMGKADCPLPNLNGKIIMSPASRLMNNFPDDSSVTVECAIGHKKEKGSNLIFCTNGTWSPPELICKKMDCGSPNVLPHMTYSIPDGTLFGALIKPNCDRGYDLEGSSYWQCLVNGWRGKSECKLITCDEPISIDHGNFSKPRKIPEFDDVIEYSCDDNYILVGDSSITCGEYGEYSSPPPQCIVITQTTASTTTNKATTTATVTATATTHLHERHEEQLITHSLSSSIAIIICVFIVFVFLIIFYLGYRNYKQRGSYNTGEELRTKQELLLNQSL